MVALFALIAGIVLELPAWYFVIGFLCLVIDGMAISH
jgi:hypothetical protein